MNGMARTLMLVLACAVALAVPATRVLGFAATAGLLALTLAVSSRAYLKGRRGDCGCFGDLVRMPLGRGTFVRQAILGLIVGLGLISTAKPPWVTDLPAPTLVLATLAVPLTVATVGAAVRALRAIREVTG